MNSNSLILCIFFVDEILKIKGEINSQNKLSVSEIVWLYPSLIPRVRALILPALVVITKINLNEYIIMSFP